MERRRRLLLHGLRGADQAANVFASSIEDVWRSETVRQRKQDMLEGKLLDVCARGMGLK